MNCIITRDHLWWFIIARKVYRWIFYKMIPVLPCPPAWLHYVPARRDSTPCDYKCRFVLIVKQLAPLFSSQHTNYKKHRHFYHHNRWLHRFCIIFIILSFFPYCNLWSKHFTFILKYYVWFRLYSDQSVWVMCSDGHWNAEWLISTQVAQWTMCSSALYALPLHMGESAMGHWLRSWQWFLRMHSPRADASCRGADSQAVNLLLISTKNVWV